MDEIKKLRKHVNWLFVIAGFELGCIIFIVYFLIRY